MTKKKYQKLTEEMAEDILKAGVALEGTDFAVGLFDQEDHFHRLARKLINAGYCKAGDMRKETVRAIYQELRPFIKMEINQNCRIDVCFTNGQDDKIQSYKRIMEQFADMAFTLNWGSVERSSDGLPKNIEVLKETAAYISNLIKKIYQLEQDLGQCENGYRLELQTANMQIRRLEQEIAKNKRRNKQ